MILDIPTDVEFHRSAERFLSSAWADVVEWLRYEKYVGESEQYGIQADRSAAASATSNASDQLAIAHISAYTGVEHLLRARVAAVSPFLLISGTAQDWPKGCDKKDVAFADFRTSDAQDLIRICNTVASTRLSEEFGQKYHSLRSLRNSLVHSHSQKSNVVVKELLTAILYCMHTLVGPLIWIHWRRERLARLHIDGDSNVSWSTALIEELRLAIGVLGARECTLYLGINKRRRTYACPACFDSRTRFERKADVEVEGVAQLLDRDRLACVVCGQERKIVRRKCTYGYNSWKCPGDVISQGSDGDETCMSCGTSLSELGE